MTAGEEALREAARLETARIYGQLDEAAREHRAGRRERAQDSVVVVDITAARRRRSA